ncbi:MAG TPA: hypothetical protein VFN49_03680 [Candidatus Aquilonibacter sp.]|nr:hypothetical protein [Candidatus Aquilonibacter sp.]
MKVFAPLVTLWNSIANVLSAFFVDEYEQEPAANRTRDLPKPKRAASSRKTTSKKKPAKKVARKKKSAVRKAPKRKASR